MIRQFASFSALLWLASAQHITTAASAPPFTVLHPPEQSVVAGAGLSHLVVEMRSPARLTVRLNGRPTDSASTDNIRHYPVRLEFGVNIIDIEVFEGEQLIARENRQLFFFSPIAGEKKEVPDGFARKPFHDGNTATRACAGCHILEPQKSDVSPSSPSASSCASCHRGLLQFRQVHGPASLWNCLVCHDPKSAPAKYATPVPVRDLCYGCHTDQKSYFFSAQYQHGPTATGMCTICHNPHASNNEFWLKKPPWELCTTCHAEKASGRHILAWGPTGDTHPTRGRPDPMKPEREFSCRSCHNPHASNAPKLWNFDVTETYQLCWTCHQK